MATGLSLRGAEDLAFDPDTGRLFISAYDRRAAEAAAKRNATVVPYGGVFAVDVDMLFDLQAEPLKLASLVASSDIAGGLRPHGLEFDKAAGELVFINRTYERRGRKWKLSPKIQRIGVNGEMVIGGKRQRSLRSERHRHRRGRRAGDDGRSPKLRLASRF